MADLVFRTVLELTVAISRDIMAAFESQWMMTSVLVMFRLQRSAASLKKKNAYILQFKMGYF